MYTERFFLNLWYEYALTWRKLDLQTLVANFKGPQCSPRPPKLNDWPRIMINLKWHFIYFLSCYWICISKEKKKRSDYKPKVSIMKPCVLLHLRGLIEKYRDFRVHIILHCPRRGWDKRVRTSLCEVTGRSIALVVRDVQFRCVLF
jgi:hypothetical protein